MQPMEVVRRGSGCAAPGDGMAEFTPVIPEKKFGRDASRLQGLGLQIHEIDIHWAAGAGRGLEDLHQDADGLSVVLGLLVRYRQICAPYKASGRELSWFHAVPRGRLNGLRPSTQIMGLGSISLRTVAAP